MKFRKMPAKEARHRGPGRLEKMSLEDIRKEFVIPMKFMARKRCGKIRIIRKN